MNKDLDQDLSHGRLIRTENGIDKFTFHSFADAIYPEKSDNAERIRVNWLNEWMLEEGYTADAFTITKRDAKLISSGLIGDTYELTYYLSAERSKRIPPSLLDNEKEDLIAGILISQNPRAAQDLEELTFPPSYIEIIQAILSDLSIMQDTPQLSTLKQRLQKGGIKKRVTNEIYLATYPSGEVPQIELQLRSGHRFVTELGIMPRILNEREVAANGLALMGKRMRESQAELKINTTSEIDWNDFWSQFLVQLPIELMTYN